MEAVLITTSSNSFQTQGKLVLIENGIEIFDCVTLEPPWKNNQVGISCLPAGKYRIAPRTSAESPTKKYPHFIIRGTGKRSYILIHRGAFRRDTRGCILVGRYFVDLDGDGQMDISNSKAVLELLTKYIKTDIPLEIRR